MLAVLRTVDLALDIYTWIIIASAVFSWLYAFNVVNSRNRFVASIGEFLYKVTEPVLRPIRKILPDLGGIDIDLSDVLSGSRQRSQGFAISRRRRHRIDAKLRRRMERNGLESTTPRGAALPVSGVQAGSDAERDRFRSGRS